MGIPSDKQGYFISYCRLLCQNVQWPSTLIGRTLWDFLLSKYYGQTMGIFSPLNQFLLETDFVNEEIQEDYLSWHQSSRHNTFEFRTRSQSKII